MNSIPDCIITGSIETNCWIYQGPEFHALIDPGDDAESIIAFLDEKNFVPTHILLTHGHLDHLAALPELMAHFSALNRRPLIGVHKDDSIYLGSESFAPHVKCMGAALGDDPGSAEIFVKNLWKPMPDPDIFLNEADTIGPFKVLHLPGHTPGSLAFYDEEAGVIFTGDTLFNGNYGRTDLPGGSENQLMKSLKRLLSLDGMVLVCPGHGPVTSIENEAGLLG